MALTMLVVEDDAGLRPALEESMARRGFEVVGVPTVREGIRFLGEHHVAIVLLDLHLPDGTGIEVLTAARDIDPEISVIVMTAFPEVRTAIRAMKEGAADFVIKPFELAALHLAVDRVVELRSLRRSVRRLDQERRVRRGGSELIGESPVMSHLRTQIEQVAPVDAGVLIVGRTGTGKELVAEAIHRRSARAGLPLVTVNCSAFTDTLLESELFGHEKGAFTDARTSRAGYFEMADGGTLFLDEISEMKPELQAKLLRVVEGHPFRRVGGQREISANVRVIAATNRDLQDRIRAGLFREDLYFRLNVFRIDVPALRERGDDIVRLARHFLERSAASLRRGPLRFTAEAENLLLRFEWPGNVRELRNVVERAAIVCEGEEVTPAALPREMQVANAIQRAMAAPGSFPTLEEVEQRYISNVVDALSGNLSDAARVLGISRNTLKARLRSDGGASGS